MPQEWPPLNTKRSLDLPCGEGQTLIWPSLLGRSPGIQAESDWTEGGFWLSLHFWTQMMRIGHWTRDLAPLAAAPYL